MLGLSNYLTQFSWLDAIALAWFALCSIGYNRLMIRTSSSTRRFIDAVFAQRRRWMVEMAKRDLRMTDLLILASFNQMTAFFATTSVFILGALTAAAFSGDAFRQAHHDLGLGPDVTSAVWFTKIAVLEVLFLSAFFKFVWAHRLSQYMAVAIGATPQPGDPDTAARDAQVALATTLANRASVHTYSGLHAYYFGLAALAWFIHPVAFILATTLVTAALYRREYVSDAAQAIRVSAEAVAAPANERGAEESPAGADADGASKRQD